MKNILLISFYFPPYSHPGVQRVLKFAKYLPLFGYHPIVLTCGNMPWKSYDFDTYNSEVRDKIEVYKADAPRFGSLKHLAFSSRLINKFMLRLETLLFEDRLDWAIGAREETMKLVRERNIALIWTTGPPQSTHFLGYYVKKKTGIPWVIDFRDPMVTHAPIWGLSKMNHFAHEIKKKTLFFIYERMWLREADSVVSVTEPWAEDLRSLHPEAARIITTITNGFDEQDFTGIARNKGDMKHFTIVYTGRFWADHPFDFLEGLKIALKRNPELRDELRLLFIGEYNSQHSKLLTSPEFCGIVKTPGAMNHRDAISYQFGSDANLLIISSHEEQGGGGKFSGKLFEYLRAQKPILAVVPKGIAWQLIEDNNLGYTVHPADHEGIANAIFSLHEKWKNNSLESFKASERLLEQYERQHLTEKLARLFDRCLS